MSNCVKCVVVGDGAVGKTCMLVSFCMDKFDGNYVPTVFDNYTANLMYNNEVAQLSLWDTAGQDDYDHLRPLSYPLTDVFIVCYDVTSPTSYRNVLDKWYPELSVHGPGVPIVLCATKVDLRDDAKVVEALRKRGTEPVSVEEGDVLRKHIGAAAVVECSARSGRNVRSVFAAALDAAHAERRRVAAASRKRRSLCTIS
jgi:cell division control protein 42